MDGYISSSSSCPLDPLSHGIQAWSGIGSFLSFWQQRAAKKESPEQICSVQNLHLTIQNCTTSLRLRIFHTQSTQSTQRDFLTQELERRERLVHTFAHVHKIGVPPLPFSESGSSPNVCFRGVSCVWNNCKKNSGEPFCFVVGFLM
jgi:hypothetical protein